MSYSIAVVNLQRLKQNLLLVKSKIKKGVKICGVVKSNAYGHGLVNTALAIKNYVNYYAVSFLEEGLKLRFCGITQPILLLMPVTNQELKVCSRYNLTVTITSLKQIYYTLKNKISINYHIAVNTGMNRLGVDTIKYFKKIVLLTKNTNVKFKGVFSHFRGVNKQDCLKQFNIFKGFCKVAKKLNKNAICHICSSGSAIIYPNYQLDMVRIGILMYGYSPTNTNLLKVKPCLKIYAEKLQDRNLKKGNYLLYGNYNLQKNKKISIIKYGYADGAPRYTGEYNNRCMDMSAIKRCKNFFCVLKNAKSLAKKQNTIPYEILVSYTNRCRYIYENNCRKTQRKKTFNLSRR